MIIVLDASAAVKLVLSNESDKPDGLRFASADWVIAPYLYIPEVTNAFWKYHKHGNMLLEICESYIERAMSIPDDYFSEEELYKEAFALACTIKKPIYDMFYLVLARRHNAHLLTEDKELKHIATKQSIRLFE
jgi:predicted nucleic acid-binding protein